MSALYEPAFANPLGGLMRPAGVGFLLAGGTVVPNDTTAGYQPGCLFFHTDGTAGDAIYVNDGTVTSCDFNPLASSGAGSFGDDASLTFGSAASFIWETADANANAFLLQLPAGTATDVPVFIIGDTIVNDDLGLFDGIVSTTVAIMGSTATATGPSLNLRKSRGTNSAPTVVTSGDDMGSIDFYGCVAANEYVRGARILAETTGTIATTRGPGVLTFQTATDAAPSVLTTAMVISAAQLVTVAAGFTITSGAFTAGGTAYIGDTSNADITLGLTINQGAADDGILALKSSDVAHGMTTVAETDSYGHFSKMVAAEGGLRMVGLSDTGAQALDVRGYAAIADTTDAPTTTSLAATNVTGGIANTTGVQTVGAAGNLFNVRDSTNLTTFVNAFVVKGDGELYSNQSATVGTFDAHDDGILCSDLARVLSHEYGALVSYNRQMLEQLGILGPLDENGQGMYSVTKMLMLVACGVAQMGKRIDAICQHVGIKLSPNGAPLAIGG